VTTAAVPAEKHRLALKDRSEPHPVKRWDRVIIVLGLMESLDMDLFEAVNMLGLNRTEWKQMREDLRNLMEPSSGLIY